MPISVPSGTHAGDLARCQTHEIDTEWPAMIEIVAYFGKEGRKGRRVSVEIDPNQFYGRNGHGAPMSGDQVIRMIDSLRRK